MIIIFGWLKEKTPVRPVLDCYCYVCQKSASRELWRETEWVSFFGIKTLPFLSRYSLVCSRCDDETPLERSHLQQLQRGDVAGTVAHLEQHQLANKNEVQRNFLLSARAAREGGDAVCARS